MIGQQISHYRILEKLGSGGMGIVYKAQDTRLDRLVALKFLPPHLGQAEEEKKRFIHEAKAASALDHPNICTIYEIDETKPAPGEPGDGQTFIAMAYYEGKSLKERIEHAPLPLDEAVDIAIQVAQGLANAHAKEIIHRDIKPANILVTEDEQVKIVDFGLAKLAGRTMLTKEGTTLGTVAYMSPEQTWGIEVDHRTDIWSLGVVLSEMVTGQPPFKGDYEQAVVYSIINEDAEPITGLRTGVPMELERIVNKAVAKSPDERYQHADEMLTDLRLLRKELEFGISKVKRTKLPHQKRNKITLYGGVAALVVLFIFGGVYMWRWTKQRELEVTFWRKDQIKMVKPLQVTLRQITFSADLEEYPAFSPASKQLVYCKETQGYKHIFIKNLETGAITQLTKATFDDIQPAWSPNGEKILFVRSNKPNGKLEPGDVFGMFIGGDIWMTDIASGKEIKIIKEAFNPSLSPDGKRIAFDASWAGPRRIWTADPVGRNPLQVSFDPSEGVNHIIPRWAPDGSKIVFQNIEKTKFDIKIVDASSKEIASVTDDLFQDTNPVWSQSGKAIYFSSYRSGGRNIWSIPISPDGKPLTQPLQVTTGAGEDVQLAISPDGKRLAFSILKINADIWRLPVSPETGRPTREPQQIIATTREDSRGAWSPDGRMIAFNSDRTGEMNIWLYSFDDGAVQQVTKGPGGDYQPNWSPDGKQFTFFSSRSGNADIWVVKIATGKLQQLTKDVSLDFNPFFSPNGKFIAYLSDRYGRMEVWVMNADGEAQQQLTSVGALSHFLRWLSDGKFVIFSTPAGPQRQTLQVSLTGGDPLPFADVIGGSHISFSPDYSMVMDVSGHKTLWVSPVKSPKPEKVFEFEDPDIRIDYPVWSPDGKWVLFDRLKPQGGDIWLMENFE